MVAPFRKYSCLLGAVKHYDWRMSTDGVQTNFRLPPELRAKLEEARAASGRTLTQEIVIRLEASFASDPVEDLKREVQDLKQQFVSFSRKRR